MEAEVNKVRYDALMRSDPFFLLLSERERADVIEGRCKMSVYEGTPILDYSQSAKT